jgi:hypothetical protein
MRFARKHFRFYLEIISIVLLGYAASKLLLVHISAVQAETQVAALMQIKDDALAGGTPKSLANGLRNALRLSPRVQAQSRISHLEAVVETVRQDVLSTLISQLKAVTGKDYGTVPEVWIEALSPSNLTNSTDQDHVSTLDR